MQNLVATLSEREKEIFDTLLTGASNKEIAGEFGLTTHTVKYHLTRIYTKLGVTTRSEAVGYGLRNSTEIPAPEVLPYGKTFTEADIRQAAMKLVEKGCGDRKVINSVVVDLLAALGGKI